MIYNSGFFEYPIQFLIIYLGASSPLCPIFIVSEPLSKITLRTVLS